MIDDVALAWYVCVVCMFSIVCAVGWLDSIVLLVVVVLVVDSRPHIVHPVLLLFSYGCDRPPLGWPEGVDGPRFRYSSVWGQRAALPSCPPWSLAAGTILSHRSLAPRVEE